MAIITDPDNLDRFQVLVDYEGEKISIRAVESSVDIVAPSTGGLQVSGEGVLYDVNTTKNFTASGVGGVGVRSGDVLVVVDGPNINHWEVTGLYGTTGIGVDTGTLGKFKEYYNNGTPQTQYTGSYAVYSGVNGSIADGATLQALYSFLKEEWKTQGVSGEVTLVDLIQFIFPLESITREQFEIGGPTHSNWDWKDDTTRNLIRTAGWNRVSGDGQVLAKYAGIVTLGTLDADTQVYYQQIDSASGTPTDPQNFVLLGAVNQAILFDDSSPGDNTLGNQSQYLKLFARKKARTYPASEIADIGVSTLENIVNRFPLTHAADPAIVETDGTLAGTGVWQQTDTAGAIVFGASNGSTTAQTSSQQEQTFVFTSVGQNFFASGIRPRDVLATGSAGGSSSDELYEIIEVGTTTLTVLQEPGVDILTLSSLPFNVRSRIRGVTSAGGGGSTGIVGQAQDINTTSGNFYSAGATFSTDGVIANDVLGIVSQSTNEPVGTYKILSVSSETGLVVNTSDQPWDGGPYNNCTFEVYKPGMFLQYKKEFANPINNGGVDTSSFGFYTAPASIVASGGFNLSTSGYVVGGIVRVGSAEDTANDGAFLITGITTTNSTNDTLLIDNSSIVLNTADTTANISGDNGFLRSPQATAYSYNWRLFGNNGTLAQCFQWIQKQLRRGANTDLNSALGVALADIDTASGIFRGDVTDLLMSFASPNGTTLNMYIDNLAATDANNVTFEDALGVGRNFAFISSLIISVNDNLISDTSSKLVVFFTNDDAGDNLGRDYDTENAIIVEDTTNTQMISTDIAGDKNASNQIVYSYDYDNNAQRGTASAGTNAPITIAAIGTSGAQWVRTVGTIERQNTNTFSLVANLERNYQNV